MGIILQTYSVLLIIYCTVVFSTCQPPNGEYQFQVDHDVKLIEKRLIKCIKYAYDKFIRTYRLINVCAMRRADKISLCWDATKQEHYMLALDYRGHDETLCQTRKMSVSSAYSYLLPHEHYPVSMVQCPPLYERVGDQNELRQPMLFLSATSQNRVLLVYQRLNMRDVPDITLDSWAEYQNFDHFVMDRRRANEFIKPKYITSYVESIRPQLFGEVQIMNAEPMLISFKRGVVEDQTIAYMKTMTIEKPYEKFRYIYFSLTISKLNPAGLQLICSQILQNTLFGLTTDEEEIGYDYEADFSADRGRIQLMMRDAERLPEKYVTVRACAPVAENTFTYYLGGSVEKNAVIVHVKYIDRDKLIPNAYVTNIDMNGLKEASRTKRILKFLESIIKSDKGSSSVEARQRPLRERLPGEEQPRRRYTSVPEIEEQPLS